VQREMHDIPIMFTGVSVSGQRRNRCKLGALGGNVIGVPSRHVTKKVEFPDLPGKTIFLASHRGTVAMADHSIRPELSEDFGSAGRREINAPRRLRRARAAHVAAAWRAARR
jgi:hypothetical protein